uniref:Uncharacterized protein n=1 Tax=Heterorhabditis bacteriophora TaxID=37862 RepID=A0A1I7WJQ8_HETBA
MLFGIKTGKTGNLKSRDLGISGKREFKNSGFREKCREFPDFRDSRQSRITTLIYIYIINKNNKLYGNKSEYITVIVKKCDKWKFSLNYFFVSSPLRWDTYLLNSSYYLMCDFQPLSISPVTSQKTVITVLIQIRNPPLFALTRNPVFQILQNFHPDILSHRQNYLHFFSSLSIHSFTNAKNSFLHCFIIIRYLGYT